MKDFFALIAIATICGIAAKHTEADKSDTLEARIQVGGLLQNPTEDELFVLDKAVLAAYDSVYHKLGMEAISVETHETFTARGEAPASDSKPTSIMTVSHVTHRSLDESSCGPFCK